MRGHRERSGSLFSYVSIEERIPASHPLRRIRKLADQALDRLNPTFCELYAAEGRPSVPPEQLLLASLLQAFYGIRSERLLLEQLNYNLLFRWFVGLSPDHPIWHPTTFTKNHSPCASGCVSTASTPLKCAPRTRSRRPKAWKARHS